MFYLITDQCVLIVLWNQSRSWSTQPLSFKVQNVLNGLLSDLLLAHDIISNFCTQRHSPQIFVFCMFGGVCIDSGHILVHFEAVINRNGFIEGGFELGNPSINTPTSAPIYFFKFWSICTGKFITSIRQSI